MLSGLLLPLRQRACSGPHVRAKSLVQRTTSWVSLQVIPMLTIL